MRTNMKMSFVFGTLPIFLCASASLRLKFFAILHTFGELASGRCPFSGQPVSEPDTRNDVLGGSFSQITYLISITYKHPPDRQRTCDIAHYERESERRSQESEHLSLPAPTMSHAKGTGHRLQVRINIPTVSCSCWHLISDPASPGGSS